MICFLRRYDDLKRPCHGHVDRAHLIKQQTLRKEHHADVITDDRLWVPACRLHHAEWDHHRHVKVPRDAVPKASEEFIAELGLTWALDRRLGPA